MAEGGNVSSTMEGGSEALFDHECTQCRARGSTKEATDFCQDCKEFLCNICGRYHIHYMKTHTLVSVTSLKQPKTLLPTTGSVPYVAKCQYHLDRDIEMYCGTHDMVYCCRCIATEHRSCSDVKEIGDVAHKSNLSTLQSLVAEITRGSKQLHTTKVEMSNALKLIKSMKDSLLEEIKSLRKQFNKQLDALEQKIIAELEEEQNKLENEMGDDITAVDDLIIASDKIKPDPTSHFDEKQLFITQKLCQVVLVRVNNLLKTANVSKRPTLNFEPNDILTDAIAKSDCMGKIKRINTKPKSIQRRSYTVESMKEINVRVSSDNKTCSINDICLLPDESMLLIDINNNKLKRLDGQLIMKDFLDLTAEPWGLCSVSPTEVAVQLEEKTIQFISVGKSLNFQRKVSINKFTNIHSGMACCNNQLWIPGNEAVYVYSLSGTLIKTIKIDSQGRKIFPVYSPYNIAVSNDETKVYVAAGNDRVVVFNNNGDVIKELRDQRLNEARCVCITQDDSVLVSGYLSNSNVAMFDKDGNSQCELVSDKVMSSHPFSMCYDRARSRLFVGYKSDRAHVFQLTNT